MIIEEFGKNTYRMINIIREKNYDLNFTIESTNDHVHVDILCSLCATICDILHLFTAVSDNKLRLLIT